MLEKEDIKITLMEVDKPKDNINKPFLKDDNPALTVGEETNDIQNKIEENEGSFDIKKAKQLVKELLNNDISIYKNQLSNVLKLNDEEFQIFFEGNSDYNYSAINEKDKTRFKELASKFENYKYLLIEWYKKDKQYYECLKDIWKGFNYLYELHRLDDQELEKRLNKLCKSECWTTEIKLEFKDIIHCSKDISDKFGIFLEEKFVELDDVIKGLKKTEKAIEETENNNNEKNNMINENTKSIIKKILDSSIPLFIDNLNKEYEKKNISTNESDKITTLSQNEKENIIGTILQKYATGDLGDFTPEKAFEAVKNACDKINYGKLFSKDTIEKIKVLGNNKIIPHAILGLSFFNLCSNIYYTYQFFYTSNFKIQYFKDKLELIENSFKKHKAEIPKLNVNNIEESMRKIEEIRINFEKDKDNVEQLVNELNLAINEQKTQKSKEIFNAIINAFVGGGSVLGGVISKDSRKFEFAFSAIFSGVSVIDKTINIEKIKSNLKQYKSLLNRAKNLMERINEEIKNLNNQYKSVQKQHFPDIYRN